MNIDKSKLDSIFSETKKDRQEKLEIIIKNKKYFYFITIIYIVFILVLVLYFKDFFIYIITDSLGKDPFGTISSIAFVLIFPIAALYRKLISVHKKSYVENIKKNMMSIIAEGLSNNEVNIRYIPPDDKEYYKKSNKEQVLKDDPFNSGLIPSKYSLTTEDFFKGIYKNVNFCIHDCRFKLLSGDGPFDDVYFNGPIFSIDLNKKNNSKTLIFSSEVSCKVGIGDLKEIKLEDIDFEKKFKIYSNNEIESRYVLTTSFMEKIKQLLDILKKYSSKRDSITPELHMSILNDKIYIGIDLLINTFLEPKDIENNTFDIKEVERFKEELCLIFEIIEELNLHKK